MDHAYAVAIGDLKKAGKTILNDVLPILKKMDAAAAEVEAVTALVSPQWANIERTADAVLGVVIKAIEDAGAAVAAGGLNVSLDAALLNDIKSIIPAIKAKATAPVAAAAAK